MCLYILVCTLQVYISKTLASIEFSTDSGLIWDINKRNVKTHSPYTSYELHIQHWCCTAFQATVLTTKSVWEMCKINKPTSHMTLFKYSLIGWTDGGGRISWERTARKLVSIITALLDCWMTRLIWMQDAMSIAVPGRRFFQVDNDPGADTMRTWDQDLTSIASISETNLHASL